MEKFGLFPPKFPSQERWDLSDLGLTDCKSDAIFSAFTSRNEYRSVLLLPSIAVSHHFDNIAQPCSHGRFVTPRSAATLGTAGCGIDDEAAKVLRDVVKKCSKLNHVALKGANSGDVLLHTVSSPK